MDRLYLLAPALLLAGFLAMAFITYCVLCAIGRAPKIAGVKHNQIFGPFFARYLVWLLGPIERALVDRVSPNLITALSLVMSALAGVAVATGHPAAAVWMIGVAGILDVLDGRLARLGNHQTATGALLDSVSDRWGELLMFAGYAWYLHASAWMLAVLLAIAGSMMVSYTRARAEGLGIQLTGGYMQRAERLVVMAVGTLVAAWYGANPETAGALAPILGGTALLCGVAATVTAINRWIHAYRELARRAAVVALGPVAPEKDSGPTMFAPPQKLRESAELGL